MKKDKTSAVKEMYAKYVMETYARADLLFVRGAGCKLWDARGKRYLDFSSGIAVCSLGHCHPDVTSAICEQAQTLVHTSNLFLNEHQPKLAKKLVENTFDGVCFFCNSGAEANEALIKFARKWGSDKGRYEIIVMNDSFHGRTLATLAATGRAKYRKGFQPDMPGFKFVDYNDLSQVRKAITSKTAAVMLEAVQGEGGVIPATDKYLQGLRRLCDQKGILLLFDEVQCGFGRTGDLFAWQHSGITPDAFSMAKAIANGFPMGAMLCRREHAGVLTPGTHASTFGGTPLACAAACAVIDTILHDKLLENCRTQGEFLMKRLGAFAKKYSCVKGVRGRGLMIGVVLDRPASELLPLLREKGLIALSAGETVLRLVPPLIVTREECETALEIIESALKKISAPKKG
jgi:predicted acetylornithine/succinylornithine family transaminase